MKKGGFSFSAAGGPTPRDDSARSDRRENALPGCEVPPLSPHIRKSGRWGKGQRYRAIKEKLNPFRSCCKPKAYPGMPRHMSIAAGNPQESPLQSASAEKNKQLRKSKEELRNAGFPTKPRTTRHLNVKMENSTNASFLDSEFRYVLFPIAYGIVFVLGLISNVYVLFVLRSLREAKAMGEIRIYMTNLTIADLLFVCALPFWIDYYGRHGDWIYADFMCRLTGTLFFINSYCSILFLGAISVNRYWAVTRPLDAASSDHRRRGIIVCVVIWLFAIALSGKYLFENGINEVQGPWALAVLQIKEGWGHRDWDQDTLQMLNDAHQITLALMGFNCVLDPVVYFFATRKFRRLIRAHFKKLGKGEGCSQTAITQLSMDSRNQSQRLQNDKGPAEN
ncbi:hypothetical protein Q5P01_020150 [Channa striata]|uniref:Platelet-activating factor receptor n=1 Tax=Channa striata TaxID=64152 RepID=A0AA88LX23_CHASR|nr:hypothetical protein Q5P01_020150 [Channa striata]